MEPNTVIIEIIRAKPEFSHLAQQLPQVPKKNQEAIRDMVVDLKQRSVQQSIIQYHVIHDVATLLSGESNTPLFSSHYLEGANDKHECEICHSNVQVINTVCIPGSDITKICGDCMLTLPLHGVVNYSVEHD